MLKFTFLFHDGGRVVFLAEETKHFTGHAVLTNATVLENTANYAVKVGDHFSRFNIALNAPLFGMFPEEEKIDSEADSSVEKG
jgi:hypothetical protein